MPERVVAISLLAAKPAEAGKSKVTNWYFVWKEYLVVLEFTLNWHFLGVEINEIFLWSELILKCIIRGHLKPLKDVWEPV